MKWLFTLLLTGLIGAYGFAYTIGQIAQSENTYLEDRIVKRLDRIEDKLDDLMKRLQR